jgi:hypothetical protein
MAKNKKKIRKRKRRFNLQTAEGRELALANIKLCNAFPNYADRQAYLKAMIAELDRLIKDKENA